MDFESRTAWARSFEDYFEPFTALFQRSETRQSVQHYLRGLLAEVKRKNTGQMAEVLGLSNPHPLQRVLNEALWNAAAVRRLYGRWSSSGWGRLRGWE